MRRVGTALAALLLVPVLAGCPSSGEDEGDDGDGVTQQDGGGDEGGEEGGDEGEDDD